MSIPAPGGVARQQLCVCLYSHNPSPPSALHPSSPAPFAPSFISSHTGLAPHSLSLASSPNGSLWVPGLPPHASFHGLGPKSDGMDQGLPGTQSVVCPALSGHFLFCTMREPEGQGKASTPPGPGPLLGLGFHEMQSEGEGWKAHRTRGGKGLSERAVVSGPQTWMSLCGFQSES